MSPLPLARRNALPLPALQPTLSLSANILDSGHREDSPTVTITVTVTEWRTTPQPTPSFSFTSSMAWMSRDALATSEIPAYPTASATNGISSESTLRSGLVAGAVAGALVGVLFVIAAAVVYIFLRRRRYVHAALRIGNDGCRGERPSIDSTEVQRTRERMVRPFSLANTPPPSYDTLDCETSIHITAPEPAHLTKGEMLSQQIVSTYSSSDGSLRSPSIATSTSRESIWTCAATVST